MNSIAEIAPVADRSGRLPALVEDVPFLASLPAASRERLLSNARIERSAPREVLLKEGEVPTALHVVLSGIVDLSCTYKSHEYTALILSAGDVSMPAAALFQEHYLIAARTLTPARILMIDAEVLREEARRSPELALSLARIMAGQWRLALKIIRISSAERLPSASRRSCFGSTTQNLWAQWPKSRSRNGSWRRALECSRRRFRAHCRPLPPTDFISGVERLC